MGSEIIPHFGLRLDTGAYEYIPLGVFTVSSASWAASGVEITAYDNMSKLDRSFSSSSLTGTPYELLTLACTSCGLELAMRSRDFNSLANGRRTADGFSPSLPITTSTLGATAFRGLRRLAAVMCLQTATGRLS